jgi:large subunit ribosomal protein L18e
MGRIRRLQKRKTDPNLVRLIDELLENSFKNDAKVWRDIAEMLSKPKRLHAEVNVSKIQRYAREDEVVVVPGKVLGAGKIEKSTVVAALGFSDIARSKIESVGGKCIGIRELMLENPKGSKVRIIT